MRYVTIVDVRRLKVNISCTEFRENLREMWNYFTVAVMPLSITLPSLGRISRNVMFP